MSTYSEARPDVGPLIVKPQEARRMLACSNTRLYELLAERELDSFRDGRSRKITVESILRYIARQLASTDNSVSTSAQLRRRGRPRKSSVAEGMA
jgi:excisionase family DNA binding protein